MVIGRAHWTLVAVAAAGGVGELARRRRSARNAPPPPPMTTQSSPGQIAELQQAYGAEMAPRPATAPGQDTADG
jgi:hypothetical protein